MKTLAGLLILFVVLVLVVYIAQGVVEGDLTGGSNSNVEDLGLKSSDLSPSAKEKIIKAWGYINSD